MRFFVSDCFWTIIDILKDKKRAINDQEKAIPDMPADIIERKSIPLPIHDELPSAIIQVQRGPAFVLERPGNLQSDYLHFLVEGKVWRSSSTCPRELIDTGSMFINMGDEMVRMENYQNTPHRLINLAYHHDKVRRHIRRCWQQQRVIRSPHPLIPVLLEQMLDEAIHQRPGFETFIIAYHQLFLQHIQRHCTTEKYSYQESIYKQALHLIRTQARYLPTLQDLCEELDVSPEHLIRTFRQHGAPTPYKLLMRQRAELVRDLLIHTDWPVERIAHYLGWASTSTLMRTCRRVFGKTTRQIRQEAHEFGICEI